MIKYEDVQIKYGEKIIVDHLNLHIKKGEFFTLLGSSGCGKTTTLRALAGFLNPTAGRILVDGKNVVAIPAEKRGIGLIFQNYALFPTMTVYENIAFGPKIKKMGKELIKEEVKRVAEMVALDEEQLAKNISNLSGGQQQRVAIARALVNNPTILLLDEPLSNLDAKLRKQLRKDLKDMQQKFGITTVYVTHDQDEALTLSDRVAVFHNGNIEQIGTPFELYNEAKTEYVCNFIGNVSKITPELVAHINELSAQPILKENVSSYIRDEKVAITNHFAESISLKAKVLNREFLGSHSIYEFAVMNTVLKSFVKEDGYHSYEIGSMVSIYINPNFIMQYEERN